MTRVGVVTFPGTLDDRDAARAVRLAGAEPVSLWHGDADLQGVDAVVLPGGFSYGDYLRAGAISRFAPVMGEIVDAAHKGLPVLGICNGFQVLCEAGLLPGALLPNERLKFTFRQLDLVVESNASAWSSACAPGDVLSIPVKHTTGRYFAPEEMLDELEQRDQVVLRYAPGQNPNASLRDIAGVRNEAGNVMGLMPHPEHAVDPLTGSTDGLRLFESATRVATAA